MSEEGGAPAGPKEDPVKTLAKEIFISLSAATYAGSASSEGKAEPKQVGKLAFHLAQAFFEADAEINAEAIAAEKRRSNFNLDDLDLGSPAKQ